MWSTWGLQSLKVLILSVCVYVYECARTPRHGSWAAGVDERGEAVQLQMRGGWVLHLSISTSTPLSLSKSIPSQSIPASHPPAPQFISLSLSVCVSVSLSLSGVCDCKVCCGRLSPMLEGDSATSKGWLGFNSSIIQWQHRAICYQRVWLQSSLKHAAVIKYCRDTLSKDRRGTISPTADDRKGTGRGIYCSQKGTPQGLQNQKMLHAWFFFVNISLWN